MKFDYDFNLLRLKRNTIDKIISLLVLFFLMFCTIVNGQKKSSAEFEAIISISLFDEEIKANIQTYTISGKVTQTFSYCGGAAPPQHLLDKLATPVAYADKKFYIRKGKTNSTKIKVLKSFATNAEGGFSIRLSPGTYAIILEEQLHQIIAGSYKKENLEVDEKCLQKWWEKPYYILEIKSSNIQNLHFNFHHSCFITKDLPCITYIGPMPP